MQDVLNQPDPDKPAILSAAVDILNIDVGPSTAEELMNFIKTMKTGRAAGPYNIHAEMPYIDLLTSTRVLTILFWKEENIPSD